MAGKPEFDHAAAHKHFAAGCFNECWGLIERTDRTPEEDEQMIRLAQASVYHWTQREDVTDQNLSCGYWQVSRVYALLGSGDLARHYGELALAKAEGGTDFFIGYAYEALARAEMIAGNDTARDGHLAKAKECLEKLSDADEKKYLGDDLATIK